MDCAFILFLLLFFQSILIISAFYLFTYIHLYILFIFGCAGSSLLRAAFSSYGEWGLLSVCGARASHCHGSSCHRAQAHTPV